MKTKPNKKQPAIQVLPTPEPEDAPPHVDVQYDYDKADLSKIDMRYIFESRNALLDEVTLLRKFRDEVAFIESKWDVQAVAQALKLPDGSNIRECILPGIQALLMRCEHYRLTIENEALKRDKAALEARFQNQAQPAAQ